MSRGILCILLIYFTLKNISANQKVAVVLGGNRGVSYEIVKGLCEKFKGTVYMATRNVTRGHAAVEALKNISLEPIFHQVDVSNEESLKDFANFIKNKHGGIDVIVNTIGGGYIFKVLDEDLPLLPSPLHKIKVNFTETNILKVAKNYYSFLKASNALFPLLRPNARVVHLCFSSGYVARINGPNIKDILIRRYMTEERLTEIVEDYLQSLRLNTFEKNFWPTNVHDASMIFVAKLTAIQQGKFNIDGRKNIIVNAVYPGNVELEITPAQGAEGPLLLALLPSNVTVPKGELMWSDKTIINWDKLPDDYIEP